jgi:hypothetical protein
MEFEPNYDQQQSIDGAADSFFEQILWKIKEGEVANYDQLREAIHECDWNECAAIGLSLQEELELVQIYGPDFDLELGEVTLENLQGRIEQLAVAVIHYLAEQEVAERLGQIEDLIEEHGLEFDEVSDCNRLLYFTHQAERRPTDSCTVYEYRSKQGRGQAVDVWEVRFEGGYRLYFHRVLGDD